MAPPPLVCCLGDLLLDVVVLPRGPLVPDDDTPGAIRLGAGGQAANVAAWVAHLGGRARYLGGGSAEPAGRLAAALLERHGVELAGAGGEGRSGAVVSLIEGGRRTMVSDPGEPIPPGAARLEEWLAACAWLFVSGYALLREREQEPAITAARLGRAAGARVALDLASAALIEAHGTTSLRRLLDRLEPDLVFANEGEWAAIEGERLPPAPAWVLKRGPDGCTFRLEDGTVVELPAPAGPAIDTTGAGDALAAGFLVGGPELALAAAGRCIARLGAQP